ncbi:MAG: S49 family peptidase [Pseudomonadota bacterium]
MANIAQYLRRAPTIAVIRLEGVIGGGARLGAPALNDKEAAGRIERAFRRGRPVAVALAINSPGGSPTQSALIAARIRRLADEKGLRVYAFCEDVAASGGYWLATAADEIYADANSILGSIGVISAGFGLNEFIARYGIERRVYTAGEDKSMLDPFRPERERDIERLKDLQQVIHGNFIDQVKARRGKALAERDLFTGEIFVGQQAVDVGLADGLGHLVPMMKHKYGDEVRFAETRPRRGLLARFGGQGGAGAALGDLFATLEDRAAWGRYGL